MTPSKEEILQFLEDEGLCNNCKIKDIDEQQFNIYINDPFIKDDKLRCVIGNKFIEDRLKCVFNTYKSVFHFGEDYKGSFWKFVRLIKSFDTNREAKLFFMKTYMLTSIKQVFKEVVREKKEKIEENEIKFPDNFVRLPDDRYNGVVGNYLIKRGLPESIIYEYKMYYDNEDRRIIFPIYENDKLIYYTGRSIVNSSLRWKNAKTNKWPFPIWNLENINNEIPMYIFEGIMDALTVKNSIAILSAANIGENQINKILRIRAIKIVVVMDNDKSGLTSKWAFAELLSERTDNVYIYNFKGIKEKDFSEMYKNKKALDKDRIIKYGFDAELKRKMKLIK